jgi:RHS repeat-associated protein
MAKDSVNGKNSIFTFADEVISVETSGNISYYRTDEKHSVTDILDEVGKEQVTIEYDEYGVIKNPEVVSTSGNIFAYTGHVYEESTGLYYAKARYYDVEIGRFVSEDSYQGELSDSASLNLYTYCTNNSIVYYDPTGELKKTTITDVNYWHIKKLFWKDINKKKGNKEYQNSTMKLIMKLEGKPFLEPRINDNGTITIGYGYDFTKESDPDMFNKYLKADSKGNVKVVAKMSTKDAGATIKKAADKIGITSALSDFINGKGYGNKVKPLFINQNQYDALFSYFYSNGKNVFSDSKYNEWIGYGGEYAKRANARKKLKNYLINNNGNYNSSKITKLFVNSKGANIKYDYKSRREAEANVFNKK